MEKEFGCVMYMHQLPTVNVVSKYFKYILVQFKKKK